METELQYLGEKNAKILIVDDSDANLIPLVRLLKKEGYAHCEGFTNPVLAVKHFLADPPHLLVLDWHMEVLSGGDFLHKLREHVPDEHLPPVLVVTGDTDVGVKRTALLAGATDFLTKPLDFNEVLLRIRNLIHLRLLHLRVRGENARLAQRVDDRTRELQASIDELKEAQRLLIQQERLRALGALAGGVAHDFNNVLMVVQGFSNFYLHADEGEISSNPGKVRESFEVILRAATDGAEIVQRLGELYKPHTSDDAGHVEVDINTIVEEAVKLCEPKWLTQKRAEGAFIDLVMELSEVPIIAAVPSELREMLMNLIFNAADAMPRGGTITLRTGIQNRSVFIEIEDTGTGMSEEIRSHCMEPFYSTKGDKGTGLGLAIIYGIVRRLQGKILIDSVLNRGTKFTILLPVAAIKAHTPHGEAPALPMKRHLTILAVDDHPDVGRVLACYLEQDDHIVTLVESGAEALEKFRTIHYDLVITDCAMPKMNGEQLATAVKEIKPGQPVILLTGFSEVGSHSFAHADMLLAKPVSPNTIRHAINKLFFPASVPHVEEAVNILPFAVPLIAGQ